MDEEYYSGSGDWEGTEGSLEDGYGEGENDGKIQEDCLQKFSSRDYIMEPAIFNTLKMYFQAGGSPEHVIQLLSENYSAVAQTVNLLAEWLIQMGVEPAQVQERVENHLKSLLIKHFDPQKADSIFTVEGETPAWLEQMIAHTTWRDLFYKLAEAHPDCLMLNFTVKLISDAGYQGEITSVSTACQQLEVFSRVLRTSLATLLDGGEENLEKNLPEFAKMVCHGEHTYLFAQAMMSILAQEDQGGSAVRRIGQEVQKSAHERGHDASQITLALGTAAAYPRACQALGAMLSKGALNPADITVLFKMFSSMDPPPVELIRVPAFLDLFMQSLFKPGSKINQDHKHKYIHILAYAASVVETWKKVQKRMQSICQTKKEIELLHVSLASMNDGEMLELFRNYSTFSNKAQHEPFLLKVLDVIAPPYTSDFVQLFLPILENDSIAGTIRTEGEHDPVAEFIAHCKSNFIMIN
uniref:Negative elongation factor complex member C/D n=1 Tax=Acanthochromis polyacanthus TaxID=80966 RepID=A0A3Q1FFW9_9TELE